MKYIKIIGIVVVILAVIAIGFGVKYKMDQQKLQDEMVKVVKANQDLVKADLKQDDKYDKIKSISIDYDSITKSPMGGLLFQGFVNDEPTLTFNAGLQEYQEKIETSNVSPKEKLDEFLQKGE
ncbi:DUF1310 family protein [Paenilisteria rocourtiae]|uniref:Uncharacterized protein DUF1310 n=1 Tax=Listeria rocourtiae TaxID=647910 RepID=A0A4R6ZFZ0_9LIST|nr:DUF1310 family protein [Listeria rocourtiae]EUJ52293.1 hypothetical protein PROCOU_00335 [Listeria rocourtiae FSL F6-920]MBC1605766.1 DUF1310 family protein [Listeria rocourtiae]TDR51068.1 uncharacterized protein DUF1310 [Listeria rocourtiae]